MRKIILFLSIVLLLGVGIAVAASNAESGGDDSSLVADAGLELKVKTALLAEIGWDMLDVDVEAENGHVTLQGEAAGRAHQELAKEVALSVDGVESVKNKLVLEKTDDGEDTPVADAVRQGETEVQDAILESRVKSALIQKIGMAAFEIEVEAADGEVSLRGQLDDARQEEIALDTARQCKGVTKVIDLITSS